MRIIAGLAKGKTLLSPVDARVRPTSDRAREGLFSSLESEFSSIQDLKFLDLFAGSGAVGVEAESDVHDLAISNFQLVKNASGNYRVFQSKALRFLESDAAIMYDIIFMDPPYDVNNSAIEELLAVIDQRTLIQPRGIIAIERETKSSPFTWPAGMELLKIRSYGQGSIFYGAYSASV